MTENKKEVKHKLRIGLLIDSYDIPFWAYQMIEKINDSKHSEIVLVVKKKSLKQDKASIIKKLWRNRKRLLFLLYSKFENIIHKPKINALESKNLKNLINCFELEVSPRETEQADIFLDQDIEKIEKHSIDIFIKLGFDVLHGRILTISKYGVWAYLHCNPKVNRGSHFGTWEMLEKRDEVGVLIQILSEDIYDGTKICEAFFTTDNLFINRNENNFYWKARLMLPRKLEELYNQGGEIFFDKIKKGNMEPQFYYNRYYSLPNNWEMFRGLLRLYWSAFNRVANRIFYFEQWVLMFKLNEAEEISKEFHKFKRLLPPKDRFWADPFIFRKNSKYYIFLEELIYAEDKGKIVVIEMDEFGNHSNPSTVLETDYHLSYPFLIEDNGELYMLPETEDNNTIELYKCIEFPNKWKLVKTMIKNIKAVDSTILKHNEKYWLFTNVREYNGYSMEPELFLFYSDNILGDKWTPHPLNPIISNHSFSRPAGNIFNYNNKIFRPAQNCSKHYGYGMQIREIITLNEFEYEEKQIQSINPNWDSDLVSVHTLNSSNRLTVIDAVIKRKK